MPGIELYKHYTFVLLVATLAWCKQAWNKAASEGRSRSQASVCLTLKPKLYGWSIVGPGSSMGKTFHPKHVSRNRIQTLVLTGTYWVRIRHRKSIRLLEANPAAQFCWCRTLSYFPNAFSSESKATFFQLCLLCPCLFIFSGEREGPMSTVYDIPPKCLRVAVNPEIFTRKQLPANTTHEALWGFHPFFSFFFIKFVGSRRIKMAAQVNAYTRRLQQLHLNYS